MKYLLLIALAVLVLWLLRRSRPRSRRNGKPAARPPERMVACAWCGVNHPLGESLPVGDRHYCSAEHRRLAGDDPR